MSVENRLPVNRRTDYTDERFFRDLRDMFDELIAELAAQTTAIAELQAQITALDARVTDLETP